MSKHDNFQKGIAWKVLQKRRLQWFETWLEKYEIISKHVPENLPKSAKMHQEKQAKINLEIALGKTVNLGNIGFYDCLTTCWQRLGSIPDMASTWSGRHGRALAKLGASTLSNIFSDFSDFPIFFLIYRFLAKIYRNRFKSIKLCKLYKTIKNK